MFVFLFYLITFTRATIVYISNNFISRMSRHLDSTQTGEMNSIEEIKEKRTHEQASPSTSSPVQSTSRSSRKTDSADVTVTNNPEYTEDEEVGRKERILEVPTAKESHVYNMNLKRRGLCVIFNHQEFCEGNGDYRFGSEVDVKSIERTFGNLGFEVKEYLNLTFCEVMEAITTLRQADYTDCDCICIFLLSHGGRGSRVFAKDASYPFLNIWSPFTADNCSTLAGKPKLFFVQACKGHKVDDGVQVRCVTDSNDNIYTLPVNADFLFGYSTMEDYYSWRSKEKGTWYVQTLCEVIDEYWKTHDLLKMLTITSRRVAFEYTSKHDTKEMNQAKQIPSLMSTLTRDVYFTPKNNSQ